MNGAVTLSSRGPCFPSTSLFPSSLPLWHEIVAIGVKFAALFFFRLQLILFFAAKINRKQATEQSLNELQEWLVQSEVHLNDKADTNWKEIIDMVSAVMDQIRIGQQADLKLLELIHDTCSEVQYVSAPLPFVSA